MRPGVLLVLLVLLAGCTVPQPKTLPAPPLAQVPKPVLPVPEVNLTYAVTGGFPGGGAVFRWSTPALGVVVSTLHYGIASVPDPQHGSYAHKLAGDTVDNVTFTAAVPMPAAGSLFARAHIVAQGVAAWSEEVVVRVATDGPFPSLADVPAEVEAGVPFTIHVSANGAAPGADLGLVVSDNTSAGLPFDSAPSRWPRAALSVLLPGVFSPAAMRNATLTLPSAGTWYLRSHATAQGGQDVWSTEAVVQAVPPAVPNLVLLRSDREASAEAPTEVRFALNLPNGSATDVGVHFSRNSSLGEPEGFAPHYWPGQQSVALDGAVRSGIVRLNVSFPEPGTWFMRLHASTQGQHLWGPELIVDVGRPLAPPPGPVNASKAGSTRFLLAWDDLTIQARDSDAPVLHATLGDPCIGAVFGYRPAMLQLRLPVGEEAPPVALVRVFDGPWLSSNLLDLAGPPLRVEPIPGSLYAVASPFEDGPRQALLNLTGGNVTVDGKTLPPGGNVTLVSTYQLRQDGAWYDVREELRLFNLGRVDPSVTPRVCL